MNNYEDGQVPNQLERGGGPQYIPTDPSHVHGSMVGQWWGGRGGGGDPNNRGAGRYQTSSRDI